MYLWTVWLYSRWEIPHVGTLEWVLNPMEKGLYNSLQSLKVISNNCNSLMFGRKIKERPVWDYLLHSVRLNGIEFGRGCVWLFEDSDQTLIFSFCLCRRCETKKRRWSDIISIWTQEYLFSSLKITNKTISLTRTSRIVQTHLGPDKSRDCNRKTMCRVSRSQIIENMDWMSNLRINFSLL